MNAAPASWAIEPLAPERLPDFLAFFDGEAFADNPKWQSCYCQHGYVHHAKVEWKTLTLEQNRRAACRGIEGKTMRGYLAYEAGKVIGWCNAAPRVMLSLFDDKPDVNAARLGAVTCFVVGKDHRHRGVARALLEAACAGFRALGMSQVEAFAFENARSDAQHHAGPLNMYLAAGFKQYSREPNGWLTLRKALDD